ncbi:MAG: ion transporter [Alteromonadaceae bacterium]|uniref:potassium channel family protein n=1 Tax=Marinobacter sp. BGYM27 TaxID=2975597 RepID=UPI000C6B10D6|nr:potassium channel family protein [Marinobacter sp. BGYM27]MAA65365.1 ion transporter [Alteromonadaceae bacterium]MBH85031.1 ion transporter [Alteromonadaceae bacterium]MDG5500181.1 potassium channel family protein [Marinobacter sp. BGYM27]|tara:strand:- start:1380 stop:1817 length:438 start_codon:yes stop_codon:yes gene_type:complete
MHSIFTIFAVTGLVASLAILVHYLCLSWLSRLLARMDMFHRFRIVIGVFGTLFAHLVEVWMFALAYYWMHHTPNWGYFEGNFAGTLLDCSYFSITTFTTLGFGDIEPHGALRYLTGIEALTGLVLITWTASFLFLEMQRRWNVKR